MTIRLLSVFLAVFCLVAALSPTPALADEVDPLIAGFRDPPQAARTAVYWSWVNGYTNDSHIDRELAELKAKGVGGVYIFDIGARGDAEYVPAGPAFMGEESVRAIGQTVRTAGRLGMDVGLVTSSSWDAGGSWVPPEHGSMGLYHCRRTIKGPADVDAVLPFPEVPKKTPRGDDGLPLFYRNAAVLAYKTAKRRPDGDFAFESESGGPPSPVIAGADAVVDLTDRVDERGRLVWQAPPGEWTILRFVCTNTGERLKVPSPNSDGLATDHFSREANEAYLNELVRRLQGELGDLSDTALKQLYLCSYEVRGPVWTPEFQQEFRRRRGYDMTPYLPALTGAVIENEDVTRRFRYDYRKTQGELLVDAFYKTARDVAHRHGMQLCAEAGGPGPPLHQVPVDSLYALGQMDQPRGEFWKRPHTIWVCKETACAAHVYGKPIVDMEAFTSMHHWQDGPVDLKPLADRAFCEGANHFTWHTSAHHPPEAGKPGWVYHAGTHLNTNLVWWPQAKAFLDYLSRCCYLLQQGRFAAGVCYYYGDQGYNFVPPKHVDPSLGFGYDYDVINRNALLNRMDVRDGRLMLPDGVSYEILVLPERDDIDLDVLKKIDQLVRAGATVVGPKPNRCTGLADYETRDRQVRQIADRLWGPCDGEETTEHAVGKGKIVWGRPLRDVLADRGAAPALEVVRTQPEPADAGPEERLDFLHRRSDDWDLFFVRNKTDVSVRADCLFRAGDAAPELWLPETGEIRRQSVYRRQKGRTLVPLHLAPAGSVFVVFRRNAERQSDEPAITSLLRDGESLFPLSEQQATGDDAHGPSYELVDDDGGFVFFRGGEYGLESADGEEARLHVPALPSPREVAGPWDIEFVSPFAEKQTAKFPQLISWTDAADETIRHFSGTATYRKTVDVPADWLADRRRVVLDLGRLWAVGEVYVNGQTLGVVWKPPYRIDVTDAVRPGANELRIEVANTWSNRLVGEAKGVVERRCRTNIRSTTGKAWRDAPLLPCGLFGPVKLTPAVSEP